MKDLRSKVEDAIKQGWAKFDFTPTGFILDDAVDAVMEVVAVDTKVVCESCDQGIEATAHNSNVYGDYHHFRPITVLRGAPPAPRLVEPLGSH